MCVSGRAQLDVAEPRRERVAQEVSIEADWLSLRSTNASGTTAAITEMDRDNAIRVTGHDPERREYLLSLLVGDLDDWNVMFAAFDRAAVVDDSGDLFRGVCADDRDVVPGYFG